MSKPAVENESDQRQSTAFVLPQHKVKDVVITSASPLTKFDIMPLQLPVSVKIEIFREEEFAQTNFQPLGLKDCSNLEWGEVKMTLKFADIGEGVSKHLKKSLHQSQKNGLVSGRLACSSSKTEIFKQIGIQI